MNLELQNITFSYTKKLILNNLSAFFSSKKIHAIIGENGEGKSTLANIICGELTNYSGNILLDDKIVRFKNSTDAINNKICYVHQRPMLAENISIKENLLLGLKDKNKNNILTQAKFWLKDIDINTTVSKTGSDVKFFTSLCSSLLKKPEILILDEPSALLSDSQIIFLYQNLQKLKNDGMNILIITHHMKEAEQYCDTINLLKDGFFQNKNINNKTQIIITNNNNKKKLKKNNCVEIKDLTCRPSLSPSIYNINFKVNSNEILCIKGQSEDGLLTLENILIGLNKEKSTGKLIITNDSKKTFSLTPSFSTRTLRKKSGLKVGIIPTDRKYLASNPDLKIKDIISPVNQDKIFCDEIILKSELQLDKEQYASELSGGMLQRLILQREFYDNPDLLILCHPLQGLDPYFTKKISLLIKEQADSGSCVIILTEGEFPKELCTKYYRLNHGKLEEE